MDTKHVRFKSESLIILLYIATGRVTGYENDYNCLLVLTVTQKRILLTIH